MQDVVKLIAKYNRQTRQKDEPVCHDFSRSSLHVEIRKILTHPPLVPHTVYPKKYAHGFCFAVLCCGYTLTDFPISIRLTSLALWQTNECPSASKATLMNMDKYFMWIHYKWLLNHSKAKHNKTVCIFLVIYCMRQWIMAALVQMMARRLYGAKPLCKPMMGYFQLDHWEQTSVKP